MGTKVILVETIGRPRSSQSGRNRNHPVAARAVRRRSLRETLAIIEHFASLPLKLENMPSAYHMTRRRLASPLAIVAFAVGVLCASSALPAELPASPADVARQLNQAFIDLADKVSPAVVVISVAHKSPQLDSEDDDDPLAPYYDQMPKEFKRWFDKRREQQKKKEEEEGDSNKDPIFDGQGSGVVIRKEGYILTNRHVVDGADKIKVRFSDGTEFDAEVRGVDAQSDVAVIKINAKGKTLTAAKFADSDKTRVGEFAVAIGAPFDLDYSVTFGHVSAKGRSRIIPDPSADQDFLQTDANINPGNSGGPLVNIDGEVIGINTLIRGMRTGIGFAIPSNLAREVSDALISDGKFVRAYLGVRIRALKEDQTYRELITNITDGVVVFAIPHDGPAAKSALKPSDVIAAVDGRPVGSPQQLKNEIRGKKVGSVVNLSVFRLAANRSVTNLIVKVRPEAWPEQTTPVVAKKHPAKEQKNMTFGLTVEAITKDLLDQFSVEKTDGVIVTEVDAGSVADKKGLKPGDIITEINQKTVRSPREFRDALKTADTKKGVIVNFTTRGTGKFEILKDSGD
jgi:serine protease Do